jgi:two-component system invasion response regulator UvrY
LTGLDVARQILAKHPDAKIVLFSQFDQDEIIQEAYRIGCLAFVTKNKAPAELANAIGHAMTGQTYFLPEIAQRLALLGLHGNTSPLSKLDARELDVLKLMALGRTLQEIAEAVGLSVKTISLTSQSIKDKLGVHRPAELTLLAAKHKLISPF